MKGVLVGCDRSLEALLPWWWSHYSKHNSFPVLFVDFGMSEIASAWCKTKGLYLDLSADSIHLKPVSSEYEELWKRKFHPTIFTFRDAWFKKPLAHLYSPFTYGCWIDLDCEVRGDLCPLFNILGLGFDIALVKIRQNKPWLFPDETNYASGVVGFRQGAQIIEKWVDIASTMNDQLPGDEDALSRAIYQNRPKLFELAQIYNWVSYWGPNPNAMIFHYAGVKEKAGLFKSLFGYRPDFIQL